MFLILVPRKIRAIIGNAVPKEYPITEPMPPHVAAEAGPNKIQAPKADATKLVVKDNVSTFSSCCEINSINLYIFIEYKIPN